MSRRELATARSSRHSEPGTRDGLLLWATKSGRFHAGHALLVTAPACTALPAGIILARPGVGAAAAATLAAAICDCAARPAGAAPGPGLNALADACDHDPGRRLESAAADGQCHGHWHARRHVSRLGFKFHNSIALRVTRTGSGASQVWFCSLRERVTFQMPSSPRFASLLLKLSIIIALSSGRMNSSSIQDSAPSQTLNPGFYACFVIPLGIACMIIRKSKRQAAEYRFQIQNIRAGFTGHQDPPVRILPILPRCCFPRSRLTSLKAGGNIHKS